LSIFKNQQVSLGFSPISQNFHTQKNESSDSDLFSVRNPHMKKEDIFQESPLFSSLKLIIFDIFTAGD